MMTEALAMLGSFASFSSLGARCWASALTATTFAILAALASFMVVMSSVALGTVAVPSVLMMLALTTCIVPLSEVAHRFGHGLGTPGREDVPGRRFDDGLLLHGRGHLRCRTRIEIDLEKRRAGQRISQKLPWQGRDRCCVGRSVLLLDELPSFNMRGFPHP